MENKLKSLSDTELVDLAKRGVESAFEELYDRHAAGIARALASFAGPDQDLLDDLTQDAFLRVIRGLPTYSPSHPFSNWLYTIVLNVGRNHVRRSPKVISVDPSDLHEITRDRGRWSEWSENIVAMTLMRLVSRLPVDMREVVSLRIGSELSYREIGGLLGIPEGTARSRMFNALEILRKQIGINDSRRSREK